MKPTFLKIVIAFFIGIAITSCGRDSHPAVTPADSAYAFAVKATPDGLWGLADANGNLIVDYRFESVPTAVIDDVFSAHSDSGIVVYRLPEATAIFSELRAAGCPADGIMPICRPESPIEVADTDGNILFELSDIDGHNFTACYAYFTDGVLIARDFTTNRWGAISSNGYLIIEPIYDYITPFSRNRALALRHDDEGNPLLCVIDSSGSEIEAIRGDFDILSNRFAFGLCVVADNTSGIKSLIDRRGNLTPLPIQNIRVEAIVDDGIAYSDSTHHSGILDFNGKHVTPAPYFSVSSLPGVKHICALRADSTDILSADGKLLVSMPGNLRIIPLPSRDIYIAVNDIQSSATLLDKNLVPIPDISFAKAELITCLSDIILSDRADDHRNFNPYHGEPQPEWMKPDSEDE